MLGLSPGSTLVDLACGRGGYGLEIAARASVRLVGVDFSAAAVRQAREQARRRGATADFRIGDLAATGLDPGSADAVLCVDAIHFAAQPDAAYREIHRVLTPGRARGADLLGAPGLGRQTAARTAAAGRPRRGPDRCRVRQRRGR
jgi:ubiquinone/menaquinone biosynthesis C-methylase UbiE